MTEQIAGALQENILTLLVYDDASCGIIVNVVEVGLFESDFFKEIAKLSFDYYRQFGSAPKDHIADLLESKLNDAKNPRSAEVYKKILININSTKDAVDSKYVLHQLNAFVRKQTLKGAIVESVELVKKDDLDAAENALNKALKSQINVFERGVVLTDTDNSLKFLTDPIETYPTGVDHLDKEFIGPAPGQLLVVLGPANRGKSWFLISFGKYCAFHRKKVLHISLEMSEGSVSQRYIQSLFSISKRKASTMINRFVHDELNRLSRFNLEELVRPTLQDEGMHQELIRRLSKLKGRFNLDIKQFPGGALSIDGLEAYLDGLERLYNYKPDLILLDYADLMKLDSQNLRISTGEIYKDLRRIAVERNIAVVTASQANRLGEDSRVISLKHLAEDYSKAATADIVLAYCQTQQELELNLARIFVAKARDEARGQIFLISQAYNIGQFCLDSTTITDRYWTLVAGPSEESANEARPRPRPQLRRRSE
jgi:replicative DNA helicase